MQTAHTEDESQRLLLGQRGCEKFLLAQNRADRRTSDADYGAVTRDVADYVHGFYSERLHSTLGYVSPIEYELTSALHKKAA